MTHVLLGADGSLPPHISARSMSNASAWCPYLPGDSGAFVIHAVPLYIYAKTGFVLPPIAYAFPLSVTIACKLAVVGSDVIFVHDVTPTDDCSQDVVVVSGTIFPPHTMIVLLTTVAASFPNKSKDRSR